MSKTLWEKQAPARIQKAGTVEQPQKPAPKKAPAKAPAKKK